MNLQCTRKFDISTCCGVLNLSETQQKNVYLTLRFIDILFIYYIQLKKNRYRFNNFFSHSWKINFNQYIIVPTDSRIFYFKHKLMKLKSLSIFSSEQILNFFKFVGFLFNYYLHQEMSTKVKKPFVLYICVFFHHTYVTNRLT